MAIKILAIGKKHEPWIVNGVERYEKRLKPPFSTSWVLLPHSAREGLSARQEESERLLLRIAPDDFVVLLDERGKLFDSPVLSRTLLAPLEQSKQVVFIIGGAYGVDDAVRQRANVVWSLSPLVFPHQLVRLILAEQLYRAQEIARGNPYHHE
jgi:23S rRNA (pseudouridine1915-N3)-methyltransferase